MFKFKITYLPFLVGSILYHLVAGGDFSFPIAWFVIGGVLVLTKQVELI